MYERVNEITGFAQSDAASGDAASKRYRAARFLFASSSSCGDLLLVFSSLSGMMMGNLVLVCFVVVDMAKSSCRKVS